MDENSSQTLDASWKNLHKMGGAAALIVAAVFLINMVIFLTSGPLPTTASGWFTLLQNNRMLGLLQLDLIDIIGLVLFYPPMFLALYAALRRVNGAYAALATALVFIGLAITIATNSIYSLVYLSDQYAAVTTPAQNSLILVAGEATLALGQGTGASMAMSLK